MSQEPDKYLQFLLRLFHAQMIDPNSQFYLPKLIKAQRNPTYEPYTLTREWTLPKDSKLLSAGCAICFATAPEDAGLAKPAGVPLTEYAAQPGYCGANGSICPFPDYLPSAPPALTLTDRSHVDSPGKVNFEIVGISNVLPSLPLVTDGENIKGTATFSSVATWPHSDGLRLTGNFILDQSCCMSDDGKTCTPGGKNWENHGFGTFAALIKSSTVSATATAYFDNSGALQLTVHSLDFNLASDTTNLIISAEILSITDPKVRASWQQTLQPMLDSATTRTAIMDNIKDQLASESTKKDFEKAINDALRNFSSQSTAEMLAAAPEALRREAPPDFATRR